MAVRRAMRLSTLLLVTAVLSVPLVGHTQANPVASTPVLDFKTVVLHDSKTMYLSVKNVGNAPILYTGPSGPFSVDFKIVTAEFKSPLLPDSVMGFNVKFSPQSITANHQHLDSIHFKFTGIPDVVVQLVGMDHVPILGSVAIEDTFLGMANQNIMIPQLLTSTFKGSLDSVYTFSEQLEYDAQIMTLQSVAVGPAIAGWSVQSFEPVLGAPRIRANANGATAISSTGVMLLFEFKLVPIVQNYRWTTILQDSLVFGTGFEPLMSSLPGKITVIDSCTPITGTGTKTGSMIEPNMPNPFQSATTFTYQVGSSPDGGLLHVRLHLYDASGKLVDCPVDRDAEPGTYSVSVARGDLTAGVYTCIYEAGEYRAVRKVVVLP